MVFNQVSRGAEKRVSLYLPERNEPLTAVDTLSTVLRLSSGSLSALSGTSPPFASPLDFRSRGSHLVFLYPFCLLFRLLLRLVRLLFLLLAMWLLQLKTSTATPSQPKALVKATEASPVCMSDGVLRFAPFPSQFLRFSEPLPSRFSFLLSAAFKLCTPLSSLSPRERHLLRLRFIPLLFNYRFSPAGSFPSVSLSSHLSRLFCRCCLSSSALSSQHAVV